MTTLPEGGERRQSPRVDLLREYRGHLMTLDEDVRIVQLGPAGMTLAAAVPLSPTHEHDLRLTLEDRTVMLKARVVHTRATVERDEVTYISGVAFVDPDDEAMAVIRKFLGLGEMPRTTARRTPPPAEG